MVLSNCNYNGHKKKLRDIISPIPRVNTPLIISSVDSVVTSLIQICQGRIHAFENS